ncbi:hypothetical protein [Hymenobacter sp. BT559]|uniref:hypothetical protein n=1 Tax=Hymenobacter sp. BT559 TaxID=2795729 RepID=UPI0018EAD300|nr:hypothetical protein [Hymenobacter sp. BT559]MBJ6145601.1 hypothetical protein [Hymenobacter sp. BT559]
MAYYLNSYRPLIWTQFGQQAAINHNLPRFIDASCRREPDFESQFPSMTAICRGSQGAVRLKEGDYVAYTTVKRNYEPAAALGRYLVGGFKVLKRYTTHEEAANWYRSKALSLPSNCFVDGNNPLNFNLTGGFLDTKSYAKELEELNKEPDAIKSFNYAQRINNWDAGYREKVNHNKIFIITEPIKLDFKSPILLTTPLSERIFKNKFPNTRSLRRIEDDQFWQLMDLLPPLTASL